MKTDLLILPALASLLLVCAVGCTDANLKPLVGRWVLEKPDRVMERVGGGDADEVRETDSIDDSSSTPKMAITFNSNGKFQTVTAMGSVNREKNGTWQVISLDEAGRKMTIRCKIGLEETDHSVELVDGSTIRLVPPNMAGLTMKMRFVRD
ncbi:hypothetical protein N9L06_06035 [Mariniblastus sp.]|nr:hypothetical protein [Mariniblastus sp.]